MAAKKRVLVVDDEPDLCFLYEEALHREGFEVETATSGPRALEVMDRFYPDLVVMDIRMPGMDGIETMGRMLNRKRDLPIILNTAYCCYRDNFCAWPASAYIVKSSDLSELTRTVRGLLARSTDRELAFQTA